MQRLHYSRLCYLLLERKGIASSLRADILDALGTDSQKEEFYLQYEMTHRLVSLYKSQGNYKKVLDLLIDRGDLDAAWKVLRAYGKYLRIPGHPEFVVIETYNYAEMKNLLGKLGTDPAHVPAPDDTSSIGVPYLPQLEVASNDLWEGLGYFWDGLVPTLYELWNREISYDSIHFKEMWMKQLFDIAVSNPVEIVPRQTNMGRR
jgi:hypothetical protein